MLKRKLLSEKLYSDLRNPDNRFTSKLASIISNLSRKEKLFFGGNGEIEFIIFSVISVTFICSNTNVLIAILIKLFGLGASECSDVLFLIPIINLFFLFFYLLVFLTFLAQ